MLLHLSVQNYALIRHLEIDFSGGFSVITGETGAGKSILLGALNLMLGNRADTQVLLDKSKKCVVEGVFSLDNESFSEFFNLNHLDYEENAVLRREIQVNGKSRAFINDTPVNASVLKNLGERLIDIHSQHQTLSLNDPEFQLKVIDSFGGLNQKSNQYKTTYKEYRNLKDRLKDLTEQDQRSKNEKDYLTFLLGELESLKLKPGEQTLLEKELEILTNAEEIKRKLFSAAGILNDDEAGILQKLSLVKTELSTLSKFSDQYSGFLQRIESCFIDLHDISGELDRAADVVTHNPERVIEIKERLDQIYHLQNKHRVSSVEDLIAKAFEIKTKLDSIDSLSEEISKITSVLSQRESELISQANHLSERRRKYFPEMEKKVENILSELGMPDARFRVKHSVLPFPGKEGFDSIAFHFNANKGGEMMELSSVASGGELSRLMLAVKSLTSRKSLLPTIIFDEIDIGVSGKIADKVGNLLKELAATVQVLAITHLPQIAGKGNSHYFVYKETDDDLTKTFIRILDEQERIVEIAKMVSGEEISQASMETARLLLNQVK